MNDPTDIAGQERAAAETAKRAKLLAHEEADDCKWLMGSKRGRRMVWRLLERAGVFRLSFNQNAMSMAFAEGCKNEGTRTVGMIHAHCPELYAVMVKENTSHER